MAPISGTRWTQPFQPWWLHSTAADRGNTWPANERRATRTGTPCPISLRSVGVWRRTVSRRCWHLISPADGVIITSTAGAHLWGPAGLRLAPQVVRVNKSSNKAADWDVPPPTRTNWGAVPAAVSPASQAFSGRKKDVQKPSREAVVAGFWSEPAKIVV